MARESGRGARPVDLPGFRGRPRILYIGSTDLLKGSNRIIQGFMKKVEVALDGATFPFDLDFALRVANQLNVLKAQASA